MAYYVSYSRTLSFSAKIYLHSSTHADSYAATWEINLSPVKVDHRWTFFFPFFFCVCVLTKDSEGSG